MIFNHIDQSTTLKYAEHQLKQDLVNAEFFASIRKMLQELAEGMQSPLKKPVPDDGDIEKISKLFIVFKERVEEVKRTLLNKYEESLLDLNKIESVLLMARLWTESAQIPTEFVQFGPDAVILFRKNQLQKLKEKSKTQFIVFKHKGRQVFIENPDGMLLESYAHALQIPENDRIGIIHIGKKPEADWEITQCVGIANYEEPLDGDFILGINTLMERDLKDGKPTYKF